MLSASDTILLDPQYADFIVIKVILIPVDVNRNTVKYENTKSKISLGGHQDAIYAW